VPVHLITLCRYLYPGRTGFIIHRTKRIKKVELIPFQWRECSSQLKLFVRQKKNNRGKRKRRTGFTFSDSFTQHILILYFFLFLTVFQSPLSTSLLFPPEDGGVESLFDSISFWSLSLAGEGIKTFNLLYLSLSFPLLISNFVAIDSLSLRVRPVEPVKVRISSAPFNALNRSIRSRCGDSGGEVSVPLPLPGISR